MYKANSGLWLLLRNSHHLLRLLIRALRHRDTRPETKAAILASGLYVFSPIDLIPELVLGNIGYVDDVLLAAGLFHQLLNGEDEQLVELLWTGSEADLWALRSVFENNNNRLSRWLTKAMTYWGQGWTQHQTRGGGAG